MRRTLSAAAAAAFLAAPANADDPVELMITRLDLGEHHCIEIWKKTQPSAPRNRLYATLDLSDAGRDAFEAKCAAMGGNYSVGRCPRQNVDFVCLSESFNASGATILYRGSADKDTLSAACSSGRRFSGKGAWYALRARPGRTIWASCLVP